MAWIKKAKPEPPKVADQARLAMEQWKYRSEFYARRRVQTAQPRKGSSNQSLAAVPRSLCSKK